MEKVESQDKEAIFRKSGSFKNTPRQAALGRAPACGAPDPAALPLGAPPAACRRWERGHGETSTRGGVGEGSLSAPSSQWPRYTKRGVRRPKGDGVM